LKTTLKEFLKKDENRNNLYFYKEYALIELEMGKFNNCINILETAIQSQEVCPSAVTNIYEKAALFSLYRTVIETLLNIKMYNESHKQWILKIFGQMIPNKYENSKQDSLIEAYLSSCVQEFLRASSDANEENIFFLSNLECDTIICYVYFLYVKNNDIQIVIEILKNCIDHSKDYPYLQVLI
jgi:hypothetical protein